MEEGRGTNLRNGVTAAFASAGFATVVTLAGFGLAGLVALAVTSKPDKTEPLPECIAVPIGGMAAGGVAMPTNPKNGLNAPRC